MKARIQPVQKFLGSTTTTYDEKRDVVNVKDSRLESHYYVLKRLQGVEFIQSQPPHLEYLLDGKETRYTPDFEVHEINQCYKDEVKYFEQTCCPDFKDKVEFLTEEYAKKGEIFRVVTEKDIYDGKNVANALMLFPSLKHPSPIPEYKKLVAGLELRPYSMLEMNAIAVQRGIDQVIVRRAVAHRLFHVDLALPFEKWQLTITFPDEQ